MRYHISKIDQKKEYIQELEAWGVTNIRGIPLHQFNLATIRELHFDTKLLVAKKAIQEALNPKPKQLALFGLSVF